MEIGDLTWTDVRDRETGFDVALLPVGSTEQHGPHAPIRTDALVATELARRAAEEEETVCLPPVNVGVSEEHADFDGTLYVSPDTFRSYVRETLESAATHGFEKAVVVNGHGGNIEALQEVCESLTRDGVVFATEWTWWRSLDDGYDMGHAGGLETSLVKYLKPELVSDSDMTKGADSWGEFVSGSFVAYDTAEFSENGVVGDPTDSSAEKGKEVFETSLESLGELIDYLSTR
ncbi:MAG: creatininase family protein [Halobacteria archaeon]|nr:creatininase family protein [Halobacteria archaeon]